MGGFEVAGLIAGGVALFLFGFLCGGGFVAAAAIHHEREQIGEGP